MGNNRKHFTCITPLASMKQLITQKDPLRGTSSSGWKKEQNSNKPHHYPGNSQPLLPRIPTVFSSAEPSWQWCSEFLMLHLLSKAKVVTAVRPVFRSPSCCFAHFGIRTPQCLAIYGTTVATVCPLLSGSQIMVLNHHHCGHTTASLCSALGTQVGTSS